MICTVCGITLSSEDSDAASAHSVSFELNGGSGVHQTWTVLNGSSIELPTSIYERDGHYLSGWTDSAKIYLPGETFTVYGDTTFKAEWTLIDSDAVADDQTAEKGKMFSYTPFDVTVDSNPSESDPWYKLCYNYFALANETRITAVKCPDWLTLSYERTPTEAKLTFSGTPTDSGVYLVEVHTEVNKLTGWQHVDWTYVAFTITVESKSDTVGTISFDSNGGSGSVNEISAPIGTVVSLPGKVISRSGYSLSGWDITVTEGTGTFPLNSYFIIDGDYTAKAHWLANANVVILDGSGQIGNQIDAFVGYNNETVSLPSEGYSKDGHTFNGWRLTSDPDTIYAPGFIYTISGPTYMSAYYVPNGTPTCNVVFNSNGGTGFLELKVESGKNVVLPDKGFNGTTNLEGWEFEGSTYLPGSSVSVTSDTEFKAVWGTSAPDVVAVTFDLNGGSGSVATQILNYGQKASRPADPVKSASVFLGWSIIGEGSYFDFSVGVTSSVTLRADWDLHFTRTYDGNTVTIELSERYRACPTIVDWGDGKYSEGTLSFEHTYEGEFSGTVTVNSKVGADQTTVTSTAHVSVGPSIPTDPDDPVDPDKPSEDEPKQQGNRLDVWLIAGAVVLFAIIIVIWRFT